MINRVNRNRSCQSETFKGTELAREVQMAKCFVRFAKNQISNQSHMNKLILLFL